MAEDGQDEVAAVGASFNRAATRIEALVRSHQSLLANASHELRSPLARLKMAVQMLEDAAPAQRPALRREIDTNIAELDALVEEVLLAGRLDASTALEHRDRVDLLGLLAEEAARVGAEVQGEDLQVQGDERLLRRALRNLLENAQRYGGKEIQASVESRGYQVQVRVCDRGPGVPAAYRERIFEAFFRLPGHAERAGGVLSLIHILLARVKALLRRAAPDAAQDEVLRFGRLEVDLGARQARLAGQVCDLTSHQFELLTVLARSPGRVLTRDQIMDALKGHPLEAFDRSIDVHISRIRALIEDDPKAPKRVLTVRGAGYVFAKKQDAE